MGYGMVTNQFINQGVGLGEGVLLGGGGGRLERFFFLPNNFFNKSVSRI